MRFLLWPDISKVSVFEDVPAAVRRLRRLGDRLDASRFFGGHTPEYLSSYPDGDFSRNVRSWLGWASLVALPSAAQGDPLYLDLRDLGLADRWLASAERNAIYSDPLLAVVFELRNYEVHIELRQAEIRPFVARFGSESGETAREIQLDSHVYLAPVDYASLAHNRNIRSGRSAVTSEMVEWFNRQAAQWPLPYLVGTARERYCRYVATFLDRHSDGAEGGGLTVHRPDAIGARLDWQE